MAPCFTAPASQHSVVVVGAGVIGLTTALRLCQRNIKVSSLVAAASLDKLSPTYTSIGAGGLWMPFHVEPERKVKQWATETFGELVRAVSDEMAGVEMLSGAVIHETEENLVSLPWWSDITNLEIARTSSGEFAGEWRFTTPIATMDMYLRYLESALLDYNVKVEHIDPLENVDEMVNLAKEQGSATVVNCSGIGSRHLCNDDALKPGRGVTVRVSRPETCNAFRSYQARDGTISYVIPRKGNITLGGSNQESFDTSVSDSEAQGVVSRARKLVPDLKDACEISRWAGLRPIREKGVRLEVELSDGYPIIHNYGHGGAGVTCCWGAG